MPRWSWHACPEKPHPTSIPGRRWLPRPPPPCPKALTSPLPRGTVRKTSLLSARGLPLTEMLKTRSLAAGARRPGVLKTLGAEAGKIRSQPSPELPAPSPSLEAALATCLAEGLTWSQTCQRV